MVYEGVEVGYAAYFQGHYHGGGGGAWLLLGVDADDIYFVFG